MDRINQIAWRVGAIAAVALLAVGCRSADPSPEQPASSAPTPSAEQVQPEAAAGGTLTRPLVTTTTSASPTATTTTQEVADPGATDPDIQSDPLAIIDDLDTAELNSLLTDLDQILGDLDSSLAQDEGDIFDE